MSHNKGNIDYERLRKDVHLCTTVLCFSLIAFIVSLFSFNGEGIEMDDEKLARFMFAGGIDAPEVCPSGGLLYFLFSVYSIHLRPSIPFKLDPALRLVTLFAHLKTRWLRALFGRNPGEFLSFLAQKKSGFILIGERLSRGKVLHIGPAALSRLSLVRLAPFFRLGSVPGLKPLGNLLSIDRLKQTAIGCFAYLFYYGRLGDIGGRPSFLSGQYKHNLTCTRYSTTETTGSPEGTTSSKKRHRSNLILDDLAIERRLRQDYPRSGEKTECIPMDSKGERRMKWRMEADRLERGLAGREVRFLPDSYLLDPLFPCSCLRLNDTSRKQTTGRTRAGVDAREGTGAEAAGIGQRVGRLGKRWLTLICLSTTMVVIIAMACTVACSMIDSEIMMLCSYGCSSIIYLRDPSASGDRGSVFRDH
ncbi:hypothetical protein V8G54_024556 [Vigna mungo]|uniref:Uncharacterized protein n=1 Tax=Vigna mungo TaxID=3915 RepID=A0AAQ3N516_VIGMU